MKAVVLVAGGAGFIGTNFIRHMLRKYPDYSLLNLDILNRAANLENFEDIQEKSGYSFIHGDISDPASLEQVFSGKNISFVVNFAVEPFLDKGEGLLDRFVKTNVLGTDTLLRTCVKYGVKRYIQISTDRVYGGREHKDEYTEASPLNPDGVLSTAKAVSDLLTGMYSNASGLPVNVIRLPGIYGPYQFPEKRIPSMVIGALEGKETPVCGDEQALRDWVYVEDACRAVDLVMHYGEPGEIYNVSSSDYRSGADVSTYISSEARMVEPSGETAREKPAGEGLQHPNSRKIRDELGWKPSTGLEEGMRLTVRWYRDHAEWWKRVKNGEYMKSNKKLASA